MSWQKTKINNKFYLNLPKHRKTFWESQEWEKERMMAMRKYIKAGDVVYYIGAENGEFPALIQKWGANVCIFEPNHTAWPTIKKLWEENNLKRPLGLYPFFVAEKTKLKPKNPDKALFGGKGWKFGKDDWPIYCTGEVVKGIGFSNLSEERDGLPRATIDDITLHQLSPDVLCIDVEGAEFEVLKGGEYTIEVVKPKIFLSLHPEFLITQYNTYSRNVRDWIIDKGYKEHLLAYEHEVHLYYEPIKVVK